MEITRVGELHQHGLNRAIIRHLREKFPEIRVDLKFDGYKMPAERPLIIIEGMQNNNESISKQREAMQTIYRYQIGLHDVNSVQLSINQGATNVFNFESLRFMTRWKVRRKLRAFFMRFNGGCVDAQTDDVSKGSNTEFLTLKSKILKGDGNECNRI